MLSFLKNKGNATVITKETIYNYSTEQTKNKLEAIIIMTTEKEISNGQFDKFIKQLKQIYDLDLVISLNKPANIPSFDAQFNNVIVFNANIDPDLDVYIVSNKTNIYIPPHLKYGSASGPNIQFFNTMKYCKKYNTILLLETDCILLENWFSKIDAYVNNCGHFLISGSIYDGRNYSYPSNNYGLFSHINGVALYKTCSVNLQLLVVLLAEYIQQQVIWGYRITPYDFMISEMIIDRLNAIDSKNHMFWRKFNKNIIRNTLMVNMSVASDSNISVEEVLEYNPTCVIIHKKS